MNEQTDHEMENEPEREMGSELERELGSEMDGELERDIVRMLDGELRSDRRTTLEARLAADPAARRLMDDYADLDARSGQALRAVLGGQAPTTAAWRAGQPANRHLRLRPWRVAQWAVAAAAVTVVAAGLWAVLRLQTPGPAPLARPEQVASSAPSGIDATAQTGQTGQLRPERAGMTLDLPSGLYGPSQGERRIDRQFFGIVDGNKKDLYLMELDRVRTRVQLVSQDL